MPRKKTIKRKKYGGNTPDRFFTPLSSPELSNQSSIASSIASFESAEDGEDICPICLDNLTYYRNGRYIPVRSLYTTKCNHTFHFDCAKRHLSINNTCPVCRTEINDFIDERPLPRQYIYNDMDDLERRLQNLIEIQNNEYLDNRIVDNNNDIINDFIDEYDEDAF
jgi:hypothetical protein